MTDVQATILAAVLCRGRRPGRAAGPGRGRTEAASSRCWRGCGSFTPDSSILCLTYPDPPASPVKIVYLPGQSMANHRGPEWRGTGFRTRRSGNALLLSQRSRKDHPRRITTITALVRRVSQAKLV